MDTRSTTAGALLALVLAVSGHGQQLVMEQSPGFSAARLTTAGSALAFGRYLASMQERNPFTESGPIDVEIRASLPGLAKQGSMLAVRQRTGGSEVSEYTAIRFAGDSTVKQQVIARYLAAEEQAEGLPYSTVAITPANYKFRYVGSIETSGTAVYVFQIVPRKKRAGLIRGQIWIDSATGIAVHQAGRFVKRPSVFIRRIEVTRDTSLLDGLALARVTHVALDMAGSMAAPVAGTMAVAGSFPYGFVPSLKPQLDRVVDRRPLPPDTLRVRLSRRRR